MPRSFTEQEAAQHWCPMTRQSASVVRGSGDPPAERRCIGSGCMAWDWLPSSKSVMTTTDRGWREQPKQQAEWKGYCMMMGGS